LSQIQFLKLDQSTAFWFADQVLVSELWNAEVQPCLPYKPKDPGFLHDGAEPEGLVYKSVSIVLLDVDEYLIHREAAIGFMHFRASHPLAGSTAAWLARLLYSLLSHS
jgi:hypothetical protein